MFRADGEDACREGDYLMADVLSSTPSYGEIGFEWAFFWFASILFAPLYLISWPFTILGWWICKKDRDALHQ